MTSDCGTSRSPTAKASAAAVKSGDSLESVADTVFAAWAAGGTMSPRTLDKFAQQVRRFVRFAAAQNVTTLLGTDRGLVANFVADESLLRRRGSLPTSPSSDTQRNRRAAVRALFRTAREIGLTKHDPTSGIAVRRVEKSSTPTARPLDDDEAALVRLFAEHNTPTRHAATAALLLAGAHTSEVRRIRIRDVDTATHAVWAHGSLKHRPRKLDLDPWARRAVYERLERLVDRGATPERTVCTKAGGSDAQLQARACVTVREIFIEAGMAETPGVAPSSLTAYAGRRELENTGRIEDAARITGSDSLDGTAAFIGYRW